MTNADGYEDISRLERRIKELERALKRFHARIDEDPARWAMLGKKRSGHGRMCA